ncbi:hypothetical protein K466DRAFT_393335 [Polyporus arcularius HHB13444]|uniref:Uncharacterized protein n=1 Tax=Polyporus arcularius HHB13444 TaxID=1314778 RepID=A0A5C3PL81_9APHY|nr:hypothetical protein K466DRAFT_393335 [Polyporus arcularius HHB13444]
MGGMGEGQQELTLGGRGARMAGELKGSLAARSVFCDGGLQFAFTWKAGGLGQLSIGTRQEGRRRLAVENGATQSGQKNAASTCARPISPRTLDCRHLWELLSAHGQWEPCSCSGGGGSLSQTGRSQRRLPHTRPRPSFCSANHLSPAHGPRPGRHAADAAGHASNHLRPSPPAPCPSIPRPGHALAILPRVRSVPLWHSPIRVTNRGILPRNDQVHNPDTPLRPPEQLPPIPLVNPTISCLFPPPDPLLPSAAGPCLSSGSPLFLRHLTTSVASRSRILWRGRIHFHLPTLTPTLRRQPPFRSFDAVLSCNVAIILFHAYPEKPAPSTESFPMSISPCLSDTVASNGSPQSSSEPSQRRPQH